MYIFLLSYLKMNTSHILIEILFQQTDMLLNFLGFIHLYIWCFIFYAYVYLLTIVNEACINVPYSPG